jgi:hypothetical protein
MHLSSVFVFFTALLSLASGAPANRKTTTTSPAKTTATSQKTTSTKKTTTKTTSTATPTPTVSTGERGLAFNDPALTDYFSLSGQGSKVTWAYNWASDPYYPSGYTPNSYNGVLIYVPMLWSAASDLTSIWNNNVANDIATHETDSVLAFNEPDECGSGQSCMNVSYAVSQYQQWIQPYAGKVLLGAPAVTNGVGSGIGINYMEQFIANCTGCTVDFIPIHWYGSVTDTAGFKTYVKSYWTTFAKPVWITEFGTTSGTEAQIVAFLKNVLPWLDQQTYVKRYAYFMDRAAGSPYLLNTNDSLTEIGTVFNSY